MPLTTTGTGTQTSPIFVGETLPASTLLEAIEALGVIQRLATQHDHAVLIDGEPVTWEQAFDRLRRFVLTR